MNGYSPAALKQLVRPDRVHGSVYTDPRIFELEMERIFGRAWIYLGHESQLPKPGDFITATVGRQSLIAVRHDDGAVRAFYNRCTHRGNQLAVESCGQVRFFRCAYHGWTFRTDGTLHSIPLKRGYGEARMEGGELAMRAVARVGISRGFIFARLAARGPELEEFLGGTASSLEDLVNRAPSGAIEVCGRPFRFLLRANWKLFLENLMDAMHARIVHQSTVDAARARLAAARLPAQASVAAEIIAAVERNGAPYEVWEKIGTTVYPRGHSFIGGFFNPASYPPSYVAALEASHGRRRAEEILSVNRHNTIIYPSVTTQAAYQQLRVIRPLAVDRTLVENYQFRLLGAPAENTARAMMFANVQN